MNFTNHNNSAFLTLLQATAKTRIVCHIVMIFGLIANIVCARTLWNLFKESKGYCFQFAVILCDMFLLCTYLWFFLLMPEDMINLFIGTGPSWVQSNAFLVWSVLLSHALRQGLSISCLILMCGVLTDRLIALFLPMKYKLYNGKHRAALWFLFSVVIGVLLHSYALFGPVLIWSVELKVYKVEIVLTPITEIFFLTLGPGTIIVRGCLTLLVCILSVILARKYKQEKQKHDSLSEHNSAAQTEQLVSEKTLNLLLLGQSCLLILGSSGDIFRHGIFALTVTSFKYHPIRLYSEMFSLIGNTIQLSLNFVVYIGVSHQFRQKFLASFKKKHNNGNVTTRVHPVTTY